MKVNSISSENNILFFEEFKESAKIIFDKVWFIILSDIVAYDETDPISW